VIPSMTSSTPGSAPIIFPKDVEMDGECGWKSINTLLVAGLSNILLGLMVQVGLVRGQLG